MKIHEFYRQFEALPKEQRFQLIIPTGEPTSMFEIFQRLSQIRAEQRYYAKMEEALLRIAEMGFQQINNNGKQL